MHKNKNTDGDATNRDINVSFLLVTNCIIGLKSHTLVPFECLYTSLLIFLSIDIIIQNR